MLKTVVCDDERPALDLMSEMLLATGAVDVVAACQSIEDALEVINGQTVDLAVFDIEMPGLSGVEAYRLITAEPKPLLVFATAHPEYAVEAFGIDAIDYILKPFDADRVQKAVEKARRLRTLISETEAAIPKEEIDPLPGDPVGVLKVRDSGRVHFIAHRDVIWIEAAGDYSLIHTSEREAAIRVPIKVLEARLPPDLFVRVHRSAIVSTAHIHEIQTLPKGEAQITLTNDVVVKASRSFRDAVEGLVEDL